MYATCGKHSQTYTFIHFYTDNCCWLIPFFFPTFCWTLHEYFYKFYFSHHRHQNPAYLSRYKNQELALNCGVMLRECFRHEELVKLILYSSNFYKFFDYVEVSTFDISSDAFLTFKVFYYLFHDHLCSGCPPGWGIERTSG